MTRLLFLVGAIAAAVAAFLVWLSREPWQPPTWSVPAPEDDVQSDPYLVSHPIGGM